MDAQLLAQEINLLPTTSSPSIPEDIRQIIVPTKQEAARILSIFQTSCQDIPSNTNMFDGNPVAQKYSFLYSLGPQFDEDESFGRPRGGGGNHQTESQAGCEIWVSPSEGEIQSVMGYKLPRKQYPSEDLRLGYAERSWNFLPKDKQEWYDKEYHPAWNAVEDSLEIKVDQSIDLQYLYTDPSSRSQGHGCRLVEKLKEISEESGCPIWLGAHNEGARRFYSDKAGFKRGSTVDMKLNDGKSTGITAFTYIPTTYNPSEDTANDGPIEEPLWAEDILLVPEPED
ncbi:uncharacterized protein L199_007638 [Kwoniella botswanensis]|uniref:uncharacterized protein n=1 Tax=Kwoniella botswanensis TaxID=1268659 RepID=UPI00315CD8EF